MRTALFRTSPPAQRTRGAAGAGRGARALAVLGLAALTLSACAARREFFITSTPEGAEVRLDGEPVGRTPLHLPFDDYGTRSFTFYLDGYVTDSQVIKIKPPWYGYFPFDIVTEVLLPIGWRDRHKIHADLEPGTGAIPLPDLQSVIDRAMALRHAGPEGPPPSMPEPPGAPKPPQRAP